jgi:hypothetical protein
MSELLKKFNQFEDAQKQPTPQEPEPEPERKVVKHSAAPRRKKPKVDITIFDEVLLWCLDEKHKNLPTVKMYLKHTDPKLTKKRGGGGWIGVIKAHSLIQQMIRKEQEE